MRIAFFTPLEPVRSGISAYSADLLPHLAATHDVDVIVEEAVWQHWAERMPGARPLPTQSQPALWSPGGSGSPGQAAPEPGRPLPLWRAHDFLPRHVLTPYDLIVYQLGNATCHEFMWPYLMRYPGLIVLHDGQLHHARAYALLRRQRQADYRTEFHYAHPDTPPDVAEFVVAGLQGPAYYLWPFVGPAVRRARAVAVHNPRLASDLRESFPDVAIETIDMGVPEPVVTTPLPQLKPTTATGAHGTPAGAAPRARNPFADLAAALREHAPAPSSGSRASRASTASSGRTGPRGPITFAAFGLVTPEKRIPQTLRALAAIAPRLDVRLRLIGGTVPHYDALADAAALHIADRVELVGYVSDDELPAHLAACDVCLCLRWPSSRETSASWLRCLAAGKPTIVNDLADLVDVPTIDPRTWTVLDAREDAGAANQPRRLDEAVAVSVDILDEDHSLELAMRRLATDEELRGQLGRAARAHWTARHTLDRMAAGYDRVLALAAALPAPDARAIGLPAHLLEDHSDHARELAASIGVELKW
jgi:glycosyltransferase involved in cell wall biosynthesis